MTALRLEFFVMVGVIVGPLALAGGSLSLDGLYRRVDACDTETQFGVGIYVTCNSDGCDVQLPASPIVFRVTESTTTDCRLNVESDGTLTVVDFGSATKCTTEISFCIEKPTTMAPPEDVTVPATTEATTEAGDVTTVTNIKEATTTPDC